MVRAFSRALLHIERSSWDYLRGTPETRNVFARWLRRTMAVALLFAGHGDQRLPVQAIGLLRLLEEHVEVDVEQRAVYSARSM
jgi:hypothetical protein